MTDTNEVLATPIAISIHRKSDNPLFGESVIHIKIEDEAAGGYIILEQDDQKISINPDEIDIICKEAKKLLANYDKVTS